MGVKLHLDLVPEHSSSTLVVVTLQVWKNLVVKGVIEADIKVTETYWGHKMGDRVKVSTKIPKKQLWNWEEKNLAAVKTAWYWRCLLKRSTNMEEVLQERSWATNPYGNPDFSITSFRCGTWYNRAQFWL